jgi:nanoRNase/pAp phosphatase (c-di-AMP/oligoRNAs hydrolase)
MDCSVNDGESLKQGDRDSTMGSFRSGQQVTRRRPARENIRKLFRIFSTKDRVLITIDADPDSMASAMALKRLLWRKVRSVTIAHFNEIRRFDNLSMVRLLEIPLEKLLSVRNQYFTKTVLVDGQPYHHEAFSSLKYDVVIDHHPKIIPVKAPFVDIRPEYGATASIMTEYLRSARIRPSSRLATALIYAIRVDTRNFETEAVDQDVKAFRFLFQLANLNLLRKIEVSEMGVDQLHYFQKALETKRVVGEKIFSYLGQVDSPDILVLVADFFMKCHDLSWVIVSGVCQKTLVVVLRNDGSKKHAGTLAAKAFGRFGSAGGRRARARAEISLLNFEAKQRKEDDAHLGHFVIRQVEKSVIS